MEREGCRVADRRTLGPFAPEDPWRARGLRDPPTRQPCKPPPSPILALSTLSPLFSPVQPDLPPPFPPKGAAGAVRRLPLPYPATDSAGCCEDGARDPGIDSMLTIWQPAGWVGATTHTTVAAVAPRRLSGNRPDGWGHATQKWPPWARADYLATGRLEGRSRRLSI